MKKKRKYVLDKDWSPAFLHWKRSQIAKRGWEKRMKEKRKRWKMEEQMRASIHHLTVREYQKSDWYRTEMIGVYVYGIPYVYKGEENNE